MYESQLSWNPLEVSYVRSEHAQTGGAASKANPKHNRISNNITHNAKGKN